MKYDKKKESQSQNTQDYKSCIGCLFWIIVIIIAVVVIGSIAVVVIGSQVRRVIRNTDFENIISSFDIGNTLMRLENTSEDEMRTVREETIFGSWRMIQKSNYLEYGELLALNLQLNENGTGFYSETWQTPQGQQSFADFAMTWSRTGSTTSGTLHITSSERFPGGVQTWSAPFRISDSRLYIENIMFYNLYQLEYAVFERGA